MDNVADVLPAVDPAPQRPNRKAWKEKEARGKGRTGKPIPAPASEKEARSFIKQLAAETTAAIIAGKDIDAEARAKFEAMSSGVRARILSLLGPAETIDDARMEFANELMANSREAAQKLMARFDDLPPSVQAFIFTAMADKSEMFRSKASATARGAAVAQQINVFCDGTIDKEAIIRSLHPSFEGAQPEAIPVQATP